jgi:hypothetical protein
MAEACALAVTLEEAFRELKQYLAESTGGCPLRRIDLILET